MAPYASTTTAERTSTASRAAAVQAKLSVGPTNDAFEQEADRVASAVTSPAASPVAVSSAAAAGVRAAPTISRLPQRQARRQAEEEPQEKLQRQEEEPQEKLQRQEEEPQEKLQRQEEEPQEKLQRQEEEPQEKLQRQEEEPQAKGEAGQQGEEKKEKEPVQRRKEPRANVRDKREFPVLERTEDKIFDSKGKGEPLPDETRTSMEVGFGADFGSVRVHTGGEAEKLNRELRAQAFTHGKDVFFNAGKFEPDTARGKELLAHELTHVVQQGAAEQKVPETKVDENNAKKGQPPPEPSDKQAKAAERATVAKIEQNAPELGEPGPAGKTAEGKEAEGKEAKGKEAEGKEAEGKKGEGEAKEAKKAVKPAKKAKGKGEAKGKAAAKGGGVGAFLRKMTQAVFASKKAGISKLAQDQKKKDPAEAKLAQTEKAVVPPAEEGASRAQASQVATVEQAPEPQPDEAKAKEEFEAKLDQAVPATLEEVDKFKEEGKGRVVGQAVKGVVTADAQAVKGTYQEVDNPPPPAPPEREPEEMPELETAPETPALAAGEGVVGEVQAEHTDLSEFDKESDSLLEKEEIAEEHLEMVDEGDLAEANKERKALKTQVVEGPKEVKQLEEQEKQKVSKDLEKEEQDGRQKMAEERQKELTGARDDQQKTKSKIELQRQKVTEKIQGIYDTANKTVQKKLDDLEKQSLKAFDDGEKQATKTFEDNVKRRIDAFKSRRYDRFGGSLLWAKDKLFGMDDLPEVKEIFDSEKSRFITAVDGLVKKITAENKRVIQECKDIVAQAKKDIETFVAGLGPELRQTGEAALKDMKGKLDALDKKINDKEKELQKKLEAKREAAIKAIEEKIEKMKEAMSGLVSKLGNLLLDAMMKFFKWALKKAGFSPDQLMEVINKGKAVIKAIVTDPIGFIKNLIKAVKGGIDLFQKNIKKHLISGLISWLTGAMADVPIQLPDKFDLKGILSLVLQILGLTWDRIRQKLVKRLGEKVVKVAETTVDILRRLITEGPMALWEMIKAKAAEIKQQVMDGIRNWLITQVVKQGIIKLVSFLNPAGAIVQAILAIYNTVMFFIENWQRIVDFVNSVFESIGDIAKGALSKASQMVEKAMAMTIPIILGFLSRLLGLSGIGKTIAGIIKKIRKPIDKVVDKLVDRVAKLAKKLLKKGKAAAKAGLKKIKDRVLKVIAWWKVSKTFKAEDGSSHRLFYKGKKKQAKLMIASNTDAVEQFLAKKRTAAKNKPAQLGIIKKSEKKYKKVLASEKKLDGFQVKKEAEFAKRKAAKKQNKAKAVAQHDKKIDDLEKKINAEQTVLGNALKAFSDIVKDLEFDLESDLLVRTHVEPTSGSKASKVLAKPLTHLPGNTKGSSPFQDPPGWGHAVAVDTDPKTKKRRNQWVRGHLLNDNLHGPGEMWNLVPLTQKTNSDMKTGAEKDAKGAVSKKGTIIRYETAVKFHASKPVPVKHFPATVTVKWNFLERKKGVGKKSPLGKDDFTDKKGSSAKTYPYTQAPPPAKALLTNINDVFWRPIKTLAGVSQRFTDTYLIPERDARGYFKSFPNFTSRMNTHQRPLVAKKADFDKNVQKIGAATAAGAGKKMRFGKPAA